MNFLNITRSRLLLDQSCAFHCHPLVSPDLTVTALPGMDTEPSREPGLKHYVAGDYEKAIAAFNEAVRPSPDISGYHHDYNYGAWPAC